MATKISTEELSGLVINRVTSEEVYQNMVESGQVNEDELYFVEGEIDSLPSQAGNSGKFLTTDGTETSWATVEASDEIFVAEYDVTTFDEVLAEYLAGKTIVCKYIFNYGEQEWYLPLMSVYGYPPDADGFNFSSFYFKRQIICDLHYDGGWSYDDFNIEDIRTARIWTGICNTSSSTSAKIVNLHISKDFYLNAGPTIAVRFSYGTSTTSNLTLNVNNTGAKEIIVPITYNTTSTGNGMVCWGADETVFFTYNGSAWIFEGSSLSQYNLYNNKLDKSGGTMTGALTLSGAPTENLHAATKKYVDDSVSAAGALPSQSGNNGKFLTTNGTSASWADIPSGSGAIESGSYVGTGTSGSSNKSSLTFGAKPKLIMIRPASSSGYFADLLYGAGTAQARYGSTSTPMTLTWSNNTVEWYASSAVNQLNDTDKTYLYVAFF